MAYTNNDYGPADLYKSKFFKTIFDTDTVNPNEATGGNMPGMSFSSSSRAGFDPADFPTELDGSKKSYGLPSIWQGDMTTAETNEWANSMKTNKNIPQFMQNTFTDPMAERKGLGVYNMDFSNALNRPAEQLTPEYAAAVEKASIWRAARNQSQAANAMGGSGSSSARGINRGASAAARAAARVSRQNRSAISRAPKTQSAQYSNFGRFR